MYPLRILASPARRVAKLRSAPVDGKGNAELIALVTAQFNCGKSAVTINRSVRAIVKATGTLLDKLGLGCLHNESDLPFLTSDNPVVWFDPSVPPAATRPYSVQAQGPIVLLFPVSARLTIYGHSAIRDKYAREGFGYGSISRAPRNASWPRRPTFASTRITAIHSRIARASC